MRVLLATRIFAPEPAAASFRLAALARALHDEGMDVTVLTTTFPGSEASDVEIPVEVRRAAVHRDKAGYVRGYLQYLSFDIPLFFRLLLARRPDVVVVEPPPTAGAIVRIVCALRRIPYVYYAADIWSDAAAGAAPRLVVSVLRAVERSVLRGAAAVLSVGGGVTDRLVEMAGVTAETIGNGVDTDVFRLEGPTRDLDRPYLLYAGTASEVQGASVFVDAFEKVLEVHPQARLVFLGQGSDWATLASASARLSEGSVLVEGRCPPREAAEWLRGATASLASIKPGQGYDFARPTKIMASVACGTPVIFAGGTRIPELTERAGLGWSVGYEPDAIASAMREALNDPVDEERRAAIAEWGAANVSLVAVAQRAVAVIARRNTSR